jgi:hypothetical protein
VGPADSSACRIVSTTADFADFADDVAFPPDIGIVIHVAIGFMSDEPYQISEIRVIRGFPRLRASAA